MKKLFSLLLSWLICVLSTLSVHAEEVPVSAAAYVLYCPDNGKILLSENADQQLPMASTTKIMTTLLTLEEAAVDNRVVEFTDEMAAEGSSMYLKKGEKVTLYDLAVGMMMQSGNDAANAAAIAISGSVKRFAERMNMKAREIGMENTRFVTPSGLDNEGHYSTARDLAVLMAYAMKNDSFRKLTAERSVTVSFVHPAGKRVTYLNHNRLLKEYKGCIGGKTGYTTIAGRCLVTAAERDGLRLVAVTLDDRDDWDDHTELYNEGFARYTTVSAAGEPDVALTVVGGVSSDARVSAAQSGGIVVPRDSMERIKTTVMLPPF